MNNSENVIKHEKVSNVMKLEKYTKPMLNKTLLATKKSNNRKICDQDETIPNQYV